MKRTLMPLVLVWLALTLLLAATVALSFVLSGMAGLAAAMTIAAAKAALVLWFFMDLRRESGLVRLAAIAAAVWLGIFLLLTGPDYLYRPDAQIRLPPDSKQEAWSSYSIGEE